MPLRVRDIMTSPPVILRHDQPVAEAARVMRDKAVGVVLVSRNGELAGVLTDRDIVVGAIAGSGDPRTPLGEVCSGEVVPVSPDTSTGEAVRLMREHAVARLPVVAAGRLVGIVSLEDLALAGDGRPARTDIDSAEPDT